MNIETRRAGEQDYPETEDMTREAFWDLYKPGCDEHLILHQIRESKAFVPELDYVACDQGRIIGNIIYTKAYVHDGESKMEVLCMGPLSVAPAYQRKGIGSLLLEATIEKARSLGYRAVLIFGSPAYYHRFGFSKAEPFGITTPYGESLDAFMALELFPGALDGVRGRFCEDRAFEVKPEELEHYDSRFPYKEKHKREGQLQ